ncbi:MAG: REP-associated tyrosine transposase [Candidatus Acidiferrales bacterium]
MKRIYGFGHLHFVTFSCYRRLPLLGSAQSRNVVVQALRQVRAEYRFKLVGYVIMPEHVHLLISEPARGSPSLVLQMLKQNVSRRLRRKPHRRVSAAQRSFPFTASNERLPKFWQARFHDFNVWSRKKKIEKLAYMHANPLKRGLVEDPKEWPWSSYAFYQRRGEVLIEMNPAE